MPSCLCTSWPTSTRGPAPVTGFDRAVVEARPGFLVFRVTGARAAEVFRNEPGGHRFQRTPPTEKRGRVQTSTVTVAVLREPAETEIVIRPGDLDVRTCRGSGAGGQHRNVTDSAVAITHIPTGLTVRSEGERSQHRNRATAMGLLRARLLAQREAAAMAALAHERRAQVGGGARGDKVRTYRYQDGVVTDHRTGRKLALKSVLRGELP